MNTQSQAEVGDLTRAASGHLYFSLKGRVIPTSSACTSGSQAIGYAYEAIRHGRELMMVAGGAEELSPMGAARWPRIVAWKNPRRESRAPRPGAGSARARLTS